MAKTIVFRKVLCYTYFVLLRLLHNAKYAVTRKAHIKKKEEKIMGRNRGKMIGLGIVIIVMTVISLVLALPSSAETVSGNCGSSVKWSLDTDTGKLTISGTGDMRNYSIDLDAPWYQYRDLIRTVEIKDGVTSIGEWAFIDCRSLTSITIPDSVTSLGYAAFYGCGSFTSITIPNSVTSIGENAFHYCNNLTSITIPNSVKSIGNEAFIYCSSLTSVTIGNSVASIGHSAFYECSSLTSITIPESVTSIGIGAFSSRNLTSITVEDGNKNYHSNGNCLIETSSKTMIAGCKASEIPDDGSVTSIGKNAFYYCNNLTSITIPNSVTSIGEDAFFGCTALKKAIYCGTPTQWEQIAIGDYNQLLTDIIQFHPTHAYDKIWSTDEAHHWHECTVCGDVIDKAVHTYDNAWSNDGAHHWHKCTVCGSAADKEAHVYTGTNDADCDVCGRIKYNLNGDDVLDVRDVTALLSYLTDKNSGAITSSGDLTGDGKVTVKDVSRLLRYLAAK